MGKLFLKKNTSFLEISEQYKKSFTITHMGRNGETHQKWSFVSKLT